MRRTNRLTSSGEIKSIYETGRRATAAAAGCAGIVAGDGPPRVAVVAGRKVGGAVERNRAKRRLREAIRPLVPRIAPGARLVVGATARTNELGFQKVEADIASILRKIGALDA